MLAKVIMKDKRAKKTIKKFPAKSQIGFLKVSSEFILTISQGLADTKYFPSLWKIIV